MAAIQPQVATQGFNLIITDRAAEEVRKFMEAEQVPVESAGLRVSVLPGGCSGFKYSLNIEERALEDDAVVEVSGVRVFVDGFSMLLVFFSGRLSGWPPLGFLAPVSHLAWPWYVPLGTLLTFGAGVLLSLLSQPRTQAA